MKTITRTLIILSILSFSCTENKKSDSESTGYNYDMPSEKPSDQLDDIRDDVMKLTLEVSVPSIVSALSGNSTNPAFVAAMERATEMQRTGSEDFITLFGRAFEDVDPQASLASVFARVEMGERITLNSTNDEVLQAVRNQVENAVDNSFQILRYRINRFGVARPRIQRLATTGRFLIELPGIKEPERVRRLLQGTAMLEFWETYEFSELESYYWRANDRLRAMQIAQEDIGRYDGVNDDKVSRAMNDQLDELEKLLRDNPLFAYLKPGSMFFDQGPVFGIANIQDTARVNNLLSHPQVREVFPSRLRLYWSAKPPIGQENTLELIAIKEPATRDRSARLTGEAITNARQDFDPTGRVEITMSMNRDGAHTWARMTRDNIGRSIAIVIDDYVYSFPTVQSEQTGGRVSLTGMFTTDEAQDISIMLRSGAFPAKISIVE